MFTLLTRVLLMVPMQDSQHFFFFNGSFVELPRWMLCWQRVSKQVGKEEQPLRLQRWNLKLPIRSGCDVACPGWPCHMALEFGKKKHCSSNISCARMPTQVAQLQLDERVQENLDRRCLIVAIHKMMQHHYEIASFQITLFPDSLT